MSIEETLRNLKDVRGVFGSFVISPAGTIVARDLPDVFSDEVFAQVGPRLARLSDTLSLEGTNMDHCVIRYAQHKLHLRRIGWGLVGIISAHEVNTAALRMVTNLVVRRIDPDVPASTRPTPPAPQMAPFPQAPFPQMTPTGPASAAQRSGPPLKPPSRAPVVPQDGRGSASPSPNSERRVRMYRGRPIEE